MLNQSDSDAGQMLSAVPWTQLGWTGIAYDSASPPVVINGQAQVVTPDVLATNGVVHIIDHVWPEGHELFIERECGFIGCASYDAKDMLSIQDTKVSSIVKIRRYRINV